MDITNVLLFSIFIKTIGMMGPAFDKVVFSEAVGEIHGPVMTPFGYHLILIQEREDVSS